MSPTVSKRFAFAGAAGGAIARARHGRRAALLPLLVAVVTLSAGGCRGGLKTFAAPKWPGFGDAKSKPIDAPALAAAPTSTGPIVKPSAGATPYPTSSTPAGSVVVDPVAASGPTPGGVIQTAATDPTAVTYGVTPPMSVAERDVASQPAPPLTPIDRAAPIAPQVGPYASLPAPPPAAETAVAPGIPAADVGPAAPPAFEAAAAPPSGFPSTAGYEPSRPDFAAPSPPPAAPSAAPQLVPVAPAAAAAAATAGGVEARYASRGGSRFGNPSAAPEPLGADSTAASAGTGLSAPQADAAPVVAPLAAPPAPAPAVPAPASLTPPSPDGLTSPPVRRPDPVFRPGGTSSYRPAEQIFADDPAVAPSPVRTASFEVVDPPPSGDAGLLR